MIAIIGRGSSLYGALAYNQLKVEKEKGQILFTNRVIETPSGNYSAAKLAQSFDPYLTANRNTEKPALHISLNPHSNDKVNDDQFIVMAEQYMQEMGYAGQPYVVFKHTDIDRSHVHIVSVCVDEQGRKISDKFEKRKSMKVCRDMEEKYGLHPASEKDHKKNGKIFSRVDYRKGDVKSQIASVVRYLPNYYQFQSMGEYNALLSLFNITCEKTEGQLHGKNQQGLLYIPLKENFQRAGHSFKASLFGKIAGLVALEAHIEKCRETLKENAGKLTLKAAITKAAESTSNEKDFKKQLAEQGINTVVRRNETGRIYGITFIDHNSRTVWNGSRLGKDFAANTFNNYWNNKIKTHVEKTPDLNTKILLQRNKQNLDIERPHELFDFLEKETISSVTDQTFLIEALGGLLPEAQGEDYQEQDFANRMKKKRKRRSDQ